MPLIRKAMAWRDYLPRLLVLSLAMVLAAGYVGARYRIGIDSQQDRCLPDTSVYLIDRWDKTPVKKAPYAFRAQGLAPIYPDGTTMLKRMTGLPGDTVVVTADWVRIEGVIVSRGMALSERLGVEPAAFARELTLEEGAFWFSGETPISFDSRYWGPVDEKQLIGRARSMW